MLPPCDKNNQTPPELSKRDKNFKRQRAFLDKYDIFFFLVAMANRKYSIFCAYSMIFLVSCWIHGSI